MKLQRELRNHLRQHFPQDVPTEPTCSCGAPDHARIFVFRVNGQPTTAIVPEACELSAAQLSRVLAGARVESLPVAELDAIFPETELGHADPFENPFGAAVYLDENLLQFENLVFCPKMFSGKTGQCFRVPTREFRQVIRPIVLRLFSPFQPVSEFHE